MKTRHKYSIRPTAALKLCIVRDHPGLSATKLAPLFFPGAQWRTVLKVAQLMRCWKNLGYIRIKYETDGKKIWCIYYLTDRGYEICEYFRNYTPSNADGEG